MRVYVCSDSVVGILTAAATAYIDKLQNACLLTCREPLLGDDAVAVADDCILAGRLRTRLKKISASLYYDISVAARDGKAGKENTVFEFIKLALTHGSAVMEMHQIAAVRDFWQLTREVGHEAHRLTGFLRFQELTDGTLYTWFDVEHNVLDLVLPHFKMRFNTERFVIHDVRRGIAAFCVGSECMLIELGKVEIEVSQKELFFDALWKTFIKHLAIEERFNPKLQNMLVPKRYRIFMNEF